MASDRTDPEELRRSLLSSVLALDGARAREVLADALAADVDHAVADVALPVYAEVRAACARGELSALHVHVVQQAVRSGVSAVPSPNRGTARGTVVTACLAGERDDLVLDVLGVLMRGRRWRTVALGPDTPLSAVVEARLLTRAGAVLLAGERPHSFVLRAEALRRLGRHVTTLLVGAGALGLEEVPVNTIVLPAPPLEAARLLDAFGSAPPRASFDSRRPPWGSARSSAPS